MRNAIQTLFSLLKEANTDGKYYAFYLVSLLVLSVLLFREDGLKRVGEDLFCDKLKIYAKRRVFLFGVLALIGLWNPISVWCFQKLTGDITVYRQTMLVLPMLLIVPFALAECVGLLQKKAQIAIALGAFFILASLCGTLLPFGNMVCAYERMSLPDDVKMLLTQLPKSEYTRLCAPDDILVWVRKERADITLVYGKDILDSSLNGKFHTFYGQEAYCLHDSINTNTVSALDTVVLAEESQCNYFIFDNDKEDLIYLEDNGYICLASTERYSLYWDPACEEGMEGD